MHGESGGANGKGVYGSASASKGIGVYGSAGGKVVQEVDDAWHHAEASDQTIETQGTGASIQYQWQ